MPRGVVLGGDGRPSSGDVLDELRFVARGVEHHGVTFQREVNVQGEVERPRETPKSKLPTLREQRAITTKRIIDEWKRSGILPPELVRSIQKQAWSKGRPLTTEQTITQIEAWIPKFLEQVDKGMSPNLAGREV